MVYGFLFSDKFNKQFTKLQKQIQQRIIFSLERIRVRPHTHLKKLIGNPYFSLRVGDYRVILNIKENKLIIYVIEVGHRKRVYK